MRQSISASFNATSPVLLLRFKHAELLRAALLDGRLTPAQKPWAQKQTLAALRKYLNNQSTH